MQLNKNHILSNDIKSKDISIGPLENMPEKVIQFGEGNFLRAFVDWQFNELNKQGLFNGRVVLVQPLEKGMVNTINEQDGLYTLLLRGIQQGKEIEKTEIITSVSRGLNPYEDWKGFLECAANPELRYMVSNTTEAGIAYSNLPFPEDACPSTFPAKAAAFLYERFKKFNGDANKGLIILACELIENNGSTLKKYILRHAEDWKLGKDFINWIENANYFCNTLVDRIVPGYPKDEIKEITEKLGYEDKVIVAAEIFHLWVIEGDEKIKDELPFAKAGLNVAWTNDLQKYRTLKVRILNGSHTTFTIPSFLAGNDTVRDSVNDEVIGKYLNEALFKEIIPVLNFPEEKKLEFAKEIFGRFRNPFIKHYLLSIALNSVSKFKVRVLPSLLEYQKANKRLPDALTFSLAALILFYKNKFSGEAKLRDYQLNDDDAVINYFKELSSITDARTAVAKVLSNKDFWDVDLNLVEGMTDKVTEYFTAICQSGVRESIIKLLKK
ncbi:MAG: tagaturonate reductase [Ignavibacteriaceae bacterium]|nr:tagaturonate reductase [Ignavibacteriaceae bacterium]